MTEKLHTLNSEVKMKTCYPEIVMVALKWTAAASDIEKLAKVEKSTVRMVQPI